MAKVARARRNIAATWGVRTMAAVRVEVELAVVDRADLQLVPRRQSEHNHSACEHQAVALLGVHPSSRAAVRVAAQRDMKCWTEVVEAAVAVAQEMRTERDLRMGAWDRLLRERMPDCATIVEMGACPGAR